MFAEIQPADVYEQVKQGNALIRELEWWVKILGILVALQILAKVIIFTRVVAAQLRVEQLLTLTERHGTATDKAVNQMEDSARTIRQTAPKLAAATAEVVQEVKEVPKKVVEEMNRSAAESGSNGGENLPVI